MRYPPGLSPFGRWFFVDVVSFIPFDVIGLIANADGGQHSTWGRLKALRVVRLLRLVKMVSSKQQHPGASSSNQQQPAAINSNQQPSVAVSSHQQQSVAISSNHINR